jgi:O-antigen/teichoic acid export membrane protein
MAPAGELKALVNIALPVGQTAAALSLLFQTTASRLHQEEGAVPLEGLTRKISSLYAAGAIAYWLLLTIFRHQVVHLLYGEHYANLAQFVPWLAVASVVQVAMAGPAIGLRAMESPASVFVAYAASSAVAILVGIPLTWALGVRGVILAMVASSLTGVSVAYALLLRKRTSATVTA